MGIVHEVAESLGGAALVEARHATHLELTRALHDEHAQVACALDLQRDRTVEFEALSDEAGRGRRMAECFPDDTIVFVIAVHTTPGA